MTRRELELIEHAEAEMRKLASILSEKNGHKKLKDRVNTICGKLYELKHIEELERGMWD